MHSLNERCSDTDGRVACTTHVKVLFRCCGSVLRIGLVGITYHNFQEALKQFLGGRYTKLSTVDKIS